MELKYLENKINSIDYQDRQLLGLETRYFGFELEIRLEDTAETCYVLELRGCRKTQITFGEDQFWETNYHKNLPLPSTDHLLISKNLPLALHIK